MSSIRFNYPRVPQSTDNHWYVATYRPVFVVVSVSDMPPILCRTLYRSFFVLLRSTPLNSHSHTLMFLTPSTIPMLSCTSPIFLLLRLRPLIAFSRSTQRVQNLAYALLQAGIEPGDRVAIIAPNS